MKNNAEHSFRHNQKQIVRDVALLADEVKQLSINLAITVAKAQGRDKMVKDMAPQFTELIQAVMDVSPKVIDVLKACRDQKKMIHCLPGSTAAIEKQGAYDCVEAALIHIFELSRDIIETITIVNQKNKAG